MQSKPKSNSVITSRIPEGVEMIEAIVRIPASMVFEVRNPDGSLHAERTFELANVHADNLGRAIVHGFNQRIPDAAAIGLTDDEGNVIPKAERTAIKAEKIADLCAWYEAGGEDWSRVGGGGGGKSLTIEAIARVKGWDYARAEASVDTHAETVCGGDRKKALAELRKSAKVIAMMAEIRNARDAAKAAMHGDDAFDALGD